MDKGEKKMDKGDFPGSPVTKNAGSISGQVTKIPHASELLSLKGPTMEPA